MATTTQAADDGLNDGQKRNQLRRQSSKRIGHLKILEDGQHVLKKTTSSDLIRGIQLGFQQAIGTGANGPQHDILLTDFNEVVDWDFPAKGSTLTPAHATNDFSFTSFAPKAFRYFRNHFEINMQDFLISLCDQPMKELSNPGASGSLFFVTSDDQYIVKTVQNKEAKFLQKLLPGYFLNMTQNSNSLLPKFFGLFCFRTNLGKSIPLVIMNNLLPSQLTYFEKFDLKGSTHGRLASKKERLKSSPTLKDLDFLDQHEKGIYFDERTYKAVNSTIRSDCRVLESFRIMDYSLLIGMCKITEETFQLYPGLKYNPEDDSLPIGQGIVGFNENGDPILIFLGIIDILQRYKNLKRVEHNFKSLIYDGATVSVCPPGTYAKRFLDFSTKTIFTSETIDNNHEWYKRFQNLERAADALKLQTIEEKLTPQPERKEKDSEVMIEDTPIAANSTTNSTATSCTETTIQKASSSVVAEVHTLDNRETTKLITDADTDNTATTTTTTPATTTTTTTTSTTNDTISIAAAAATTTTEITTGVEVKDDAITSTTTTTTTDTTVNVEIIETSTSDPEKVVTPNPDSPDKDTAVTTPTTEPISMNETPPPDDIVTNSSDSNADTQAAPSFAAETENKVAIDANEEQMTMSTTIIEESFVEKTFVQEVVVEKTTNDESNLKEIEISDKESK